MMTSIALPFLYSVLFFWSFPSLVDFALFVVGVVVGVNLILVDRCLHAFYLFPEHDYSKLLHEEWRKKSLRGIVHLLGHAETFQEQLMSRSILFLLSFVFLMIFVLTSTGSVIGIGVILGMGLRYLVDFWRISKTPELFIRQFLWQVKRPFNAQEIRMIVVGWLIAFTIVSLLVLF